ncbi:protein kinase [Fibrobacterota bacterium]
MSPASEYQVGGVIAGKYVIESILDPSVNSQSFLGNENYSEEKVCIKLYYPQISSGYLNSPNFFLQAGKVTSLQHDNLCRCIEINEEMGRIYLIREFIQGKNFNEWLAKEKDSPNKIAKGVEILWQACQGLQKMHESGKHLNIHPHNIIVSDMGAKLVDWDPRGMTDLEISKYLPILSLFNGCRAPEIRTDGSLSYPSADLYSIGALVYRLLTGRLVPEKPGDIMAGLNFSEPMVNEFLGRALDPDPEKRFQEAGTFSNALWDLTAALSYNKPSGAGLAKSGPSAFDSPSPPVTPAKDAEMFPPGSSASFAPESDSSASFAPEPDFQDSLEPDRPSPPQAPPITQQTMFDPGAVSQPIPESREFSSELERPGVSGLSSSRDFPGQIRQQKESSLEEKQYGTPPPQSQDASYSMFGFKGFQQQRTGVYTPPKPRGKNPKMVMSIVISGLALVFVVLAALMVKQIASGEGKVDPAPGAGQIQIPLQEIPPVPPSGSPVAKTKTEEMEYPLPDETDQALEAMDSESRDLEQRAGQSRKKNIASKPERTQEEKGPPVDREKELMQMFRNEQWPTDAAGCLRMADELNDFGRIMEANLCYQHALTYAGINQKQKIHALGALAVTYNTMNQPDEARKSIGELLKLDPDNRFGLSYREKIE